MARVVLFLFLLVAIAGCDESSDGDGDIDADSGGDGDADIDGDADGDADADEDADAGGDGSTDADWLHDAQPLSELPFRATQSHHLVCESEEIDERDHDILCHFVYDGIDIELLVRATPYGCDESWVVHYHTQGYVREGGEITRVPAHYNCGGRHRNDWLSFRHDGVTYTIDQASLGYGSRACAAPNCILVCRGDEPCPHLYGPGLDDVAVNGCERENGGPAPPHPVTCVAVNADGTVPPLLAPWQAHDGHEDYPILPCEGEWVEQ